MPQNVKTLHISTNLFGENLTASIGQQTILQQTANTALVN
jgi:hypothetical protein